MIARVALIAPYWSFFEGAVAFDLRADRARLTDEVARLLRAARVEVAAVEIVDSPDACKVAGGHIAAAAPDAVIVLISMCAPPTHGLAALDEIPTAPVVVLVAHEDERPGPAFDHAQVTAAGATVGGPQLVNMLERRGRPYALVVGWLGDPQLHQQLGSAARAAAGAGRLQRARIARVGVPIEGYECVDCDPQALREATGIEFVPVPPATVRDAYLAAAAERTAVIEDEVRARWDIAPGIEGDDCLSPSLRFAAALEQLDQQFELDAGAMNCHVPEIRFADDPGIAPCFALGRETTRGIPWTCAGDVITAVAMLTLKLLGAAALYHEIETLDYASDEAILANSGEHDLLFCAEGERPLLDRNIWWANGAGRCGACARFGPSPGPATLVAFTPHPSEPSGFRYVIAEGEFTERRVPATGTVNAAFRFAGARTVAEAWARWARAGVNHHSAATPGHLGDAVAAVASHLNVGCVRVS